MTGRKCRTDMYISDCLVHIFVIMSVRLCASSKTLYIQLVSELYKVYNPKEISAITGISLRKVYRIITESKKNPVISSTGCPVCRHGCKDRVTVERSANSIKFHCNKCQAKIKLPKRLWREDKGTIEFTPGATEGRGGGGQATDIRDCTGLHDTVEHLQVSKKKRRCKQ